MQDNKDNCQFVSSEISSLIITLVSNLWFEHNGLSLLLNKYGIVGVDLQLQTSYFIIKNFIKHWRENVLFSVSVDFLHFIQNTRSQFNHGFNFEPMFFEQCNPPNLYHVY